MTGKRLTKEEQEVLDKIAGYTFGCKFRECKTDARLAIMHEAYTSGLINSYKDDSESSKENVKCAGDDGDKGYILTENKRFKKGIY